MSAVIHGKCPTCRQRYRLGLHEGTSPVEEVLRRNTAKPRTYSVQQCVTCRSAAIQWYVPTAAEVEAADREILERWDRQLQLQLQQQDLDLELILPRSVSLLERWAAAWRGWWSRRRKL